MNRTKSQQGSALLRDWFLRPSKDILLIQNRLKAVSFFVNSRNVEAVVALQDALKNTKNILVSFYNLQYKLFIISCLYKLFMS